MRFLPELPKVSKAFCAILAQKTRVSKDFWTCSSSPQFTGSQRLESVCEAKVVLKVTEKLQPLQPMIASQHLKERVTYLKEELEFLALRQADMDRRKADLEKLLKEARAQMPSEEAGAPMQQLASADP